MAFSIQDIKRIVIIALASDDRLMETLVLKGGNAIELLQKDRSKLSRASYDIDFSMAEDFDEELEEIKMRIESTLKQTFGENGLILIDFKFTSRPSRIEASFHDFWGGYNIEFKLVTPHLMATVNGDARKLSGRAIKFLPGGSPKIEVEISKYEYIDARKELSIDGYPIYIYSPEMIAFEKVRAICQQLPQYSEVVPSHSPRRRARDFYDIHLIMTQHQVDPSTEENKAILSHVFAAKRVPLSYIQQINEHLDFHRQDWPNVLETMPEKEEIGDFDFYAGYVLDQFQPLTFPWDKRVASHWSMQDPSYRNPDKN